MRATKYTGDYTLFSKPETGRSITLSANITYMINKLDSWSKYPRRNVSLIATTNKYYPELFKDWDKDNKIHIVIPFDNSKGSIGMTSEGK